MAIKKIIVSNFKSFDKVDVDLGKFSVLIGANASGKSNFIQIFKFMRDLTSFGLDNAISMQGGLQYLVNTNIGSSQEFSIEVICDSVEEYEPPLFSSRKLMIGYAVFEATYKFALNLAKTQKSFEITEDKLSFRCKFYNFVRHGRSLTKKEELGEGEISLLRIAGNPDLQLKQPKGLKIKEDELFPVFVARNLLRESKLGYRNLLIEYPSSFYIGREMKSSLQNISIYDFDPRLSKKPQTITGRAGLEEDGRNLAIVVNNLLKSGVKKRKLYNLMGELLPFASELKTEKFADTILFKLREKYSGNQFFPSFLISDGTINLTALIIALYFEDRALTVIEEPERNIHPYLISKVVDMMREASEKTQIITTTHNPEVVKHVDPKEILLVSRTREGYSRISKPAEKEEIRIFLENEMGIEELYVENLLEV